MVESLARRVIARLRALREQKGWTQEAFAEKAAISYKYYQAIEAGRKRDLRLSTLDKLAHAHGLTLSLFLDPVALARSALREDAASYQAAPPARTPPRRRQSPSGRKARPATKKRKTAEKEQ